MKRPLLIRRLLLTLTLTGFASFCSGETVFLAPIQDTTIYQDSNSLSNSQGGHLFSGATAQRNQANARRALLQFDVASSIPDNAIILSVELTLTANRVPSGFVTSDFSLHRIAQAWQEGESAASGREGKGGNASVEDTTWSRTGFEAWGQPGGDFIATPSSTVSVGPQGTYQWPSTSTMVDDLTQWLQAPDDNFGWILIGDESAPRSAKRFTSRENPDSDSHPLLTVEFELVDVGLLGDFNFDTQLSSDDIELLCTAINQGEGASEFDLTGDDMVNLQDLAFWVEDIRETFLGDTDLDSEVVFGDFLQLSNNYGLPIADGTNRWDVGDFNCDREVEFGDFLSLAGNFGRTSQDNVSSVPEPHNALLFVPGFLLLIIFQRAQLARSFRTTAATYCATE